MKTRKKKYRKKNDRAAAICNWSSVTTFQPNREIRASLLCKPGASARLTSSPYLRTIYVEEG
jgi:hypothetical protein